MYLLINFIQGWGETGIMCDVAKYGTLEDAVTLSGYVFKNQSLVYSPVGGTMEMAVANGARVRKGEHIASVYQGSISADIMEQLRNINEKIAQKSANPYRKTIYASDAVAIEKQIGESSAGIIEAAYNREGDKLSSARLHMDNLIAKKNTAMGIITNDEEVITQLTRQKRDIENKNAIQKSDLTAPAAGVFVSGADGLEGDLDIGRISTLKPSDIDVIDKKPVITDNEVIPNRAACKVVDNFGWYFVAVMETKYVYPLNMGDKVGLRFFDVTDSPVSGEVTYISQDERGRTVIAVYADEYVDSVYAFSRVTADVIKRSYKGLKIPTRAIRVLDDGTRGVYVVKDRAARFRPLEDLYSNKDWSIVKEDNTVNTVMLYDEVIIKPTDLEDGKIVR